MKKHKTNKEEESVPNYKLQKLEAERRTRKGGNGKKRRKKRIGGDLQNFEKSFPKEKN